MAPPRCVAVVTTARADYGICRPILRRIQATPSLALQLIVGGMHLSPEFGRTIDAIRADGFAISAEVPLLVSSDAPEGIAISMGLGTIGYAQAFARLRPDLLLVIGDRFEMHAAAVAALPFNIPIAHVHGGESTEGVMDEALRHSMTKMSHLHFASTDRYRQRIIQMGEEPWRVVTSGAPSLDQLHQARVLSAEELRGRIGLDVTQPFLLVTYHPVTLQHEQTDHQLDELLAALGASAWPIVFTYPNADTASRRIIERIGAFVGDRSSAAVTVSLGTEAYFSLMRRAAAMVGNSSSGIIEAASFGLPVVNVGDRQRGRFHAENVVDVPCERAAIAAAVERVAGPAFRSMLAGLANPYGDGQAAQRIVETLARVELGSQLLIKRFQDQPMEADADSVCGRG